MGYGYKDLLQEKSSQVIEAKKEKRRVKKEQKEQEKNCWILISMIQHCMLNQA